MAATAQQIASAKALAKSRGYNPDLVDADNADRANIAFPVQSGGYTGGAGYTPPPGTPLTVPTTPSPAPDRPTIPPGGPTPPGGDVPPGGAGGGGSATPGPALGGLMSAGSMESPADPSQSPAMSPLNLRQNLGNRMYPQDNGALAALRKAY